VEEAALGGNVEERRFSAASGVQRQWGFSPGGRIWDAESAA